MWCEGVGAYPVGAGICGAYPAGTPIGTPTGIPIGTPTGIPIGTTPATNGVTSTGAAIIGIMPTGWAIIGVPVRRPPTAWAIAPTTWATAPTTCPVVFVAGRATGGATGAVFTLTVTFTGWAMGTGRAIRGVIGAPGVCVGRLMPPVHCTGGRVTAGGENSRSGGDSFPPGGSAGIVTVDFWPAICRPD